MKIVIAPDSFKESLTALQVADAIEAGMREVWPDAAYVKVPVADGGEGTVQAMIDATGGRRVDVRVTGPLGKAVDAFYGERRDRSILFWKSLPVSDLETVLARLCVPGLVVPVIVWVLTMVVPATGADALVAALAELGYHPGRRELGE